MTHRYPNPDAPPFWPTEMGRTKHSSASPASRAALWLAHDMSRWVLLHIAQYGEVDAPTVCREWPAALPGRVRVLLRNMAALGVLECLNPDAPRSAPPRYGPGNQADFWALYVDLIALMHLSPTPEAQK